MCGLGGGFRLLVLGCIFPPLSWLCRVLLWVSCFYAGWHGHLGVDNLDVVRSIARLLAHGCSSNPLTLVKDGDLIAIVKQMIVGLDTVRVTKGGCLATEADVEQGRVRLDNRLGNIEADTAADLGRRLQPEAVMDIRRALVNVRELWYPGLCKSYWSWRFCSRSSGLGKVEKRRKQKKHIQKKTKKKRKENVGKKKRYKN